MCFLALWLLFWADATTLYHGSLNLPLEVFTADGAPVSPGKHDLEIRHQGDRYLLAFPGPEKHLVAFPGAAYNGLDSFTIPVVGTVLLWPVKEPPPEETRSKTSPYLTNLDWHATLRIYRSSNPESGEIRAFLQEGTRHVAFTLFRTKPTPGDRKP